ncbi:hypothetical protein AB1Y20_015973 [Prymnesium parvum]|uniref:Uncharacterized protein n=1 Tax=Prymnesium parvum TaxID=97485 RepID=A0AB34JZB7_PRYPA
MGRVWLLLGAVAHASALPRLSTRSAPPPPLIHRREAVHAAAACAAASLLPFPAPRAFAAPAAKIDLNEQLLLILRVKEAASQEVRLIKTGKYRELQRLNVKRAVRFMLDNYALGERFVKASSFAPASQVVAATQYGQAAVEGLIQIMEYFPDKLVANDLTSEQEKFVIAALASTDKNIDLFCSLMPPAALAAAKAQIEEENKLNDQEYREVNDGSDLINMPSSK